MASLALLLLALQPNPAPIAVVPSPPRPVTVTRIFQPPSDEAPVIVEVEASGDGAVLWSGTLNVGRTDANVSYNVREAQRGCAQQLGHTQRSLQLGLNGGYGSAPRLILTASWTRPVEGPCGSNPPSRTVQLSEPIQFDSSGRAVVQGDAGFVVRLRRR